jgi:hypothetical protein
LFSDKHIANEPGQDNFYIDAHIDMPRLEVEWVTLVLVFAASWVLLGSKPQKSKGDHLDPY